MNKKNILIVGGYGEVGGKIAKLLLRSYPNRILIAGRNIEKAKQFCARCNQLATPIQMDVSKTVNPQQLEGVALVIMCLEQQDTAFTQLCLRKGIMYIDITASYAFLKKLEDLHPIAEQHHSTIVYSVGMAPGLTNLMAMHAAQQLTTIDQLHISILLGAGDTHGTAAVLWILDQLNQPYHLNYQHKRQTTTNFTNRRVVQFKGVGKRSLYQFNFSDQHTLSKHFSTSQIVTRMGFDVEALNRFVSFLQKSRLSYMLKLDKVQQLLAPAIQKIKIGSDVCGIKVEAIGRDQFEERTVAITFLEHNESMVTAKIAATVATELLEHHHPAGAYHIEELFTIETIKKFFTFSSIIEEFS